MRDQLQIALETLESIETQCKNVRAEIQNAMNPGPYWQCQRPINVCGAVFMGKTRMCPYCGNKDVKLITHDEFAEAVK